ncbi:MAG: DegT/DnrJ/EryC1/StrS family aminotransferase [Deltaproteobacteria bacterium]|nr:DegT/DnrJ/EryC1/StrS family aminotransferase [Deltaproteobacteria bacterium]
MKKKNLFGLSHIDPGHGKTRKQIEALLEQKQWGKNEGADEMLAVLDLLANLDRHPYLNSIVMKESPVWALAREFAQNFFAPPPDTNKMFAHLVAKYKWDEVSVYTIGLSNATNALTAALQAHDVVGKEVITTSYNYAAAPNAIVAAGGIPKFADIDKETFCIDIASTLKRVNKNTAAIIVTHVNQAIDLLPLLKGLEKSKQKIAIFQDATAAIGCSSDGVGVGQLNPPPHGATIFSLGPTKVISGLGGALLMTHDYEFLRKIESIAFYGLNPSNDEEILEFGNNYKMNEISAVIALEQLKKKEDLILKRRQLKKMYDEALKPLVKKGLVTLQKIVSDTDDIILTHYMVRLQKSYHSVMQKMATDFQIGLSHWYCYHQEPIYAIRFGTCKLPVTESLSDKIIFLPFHLELEKENVDYIVKCLSESLTG